MDPADKADHACHVMSSVESMRMRGFLCDFIVKVEKESFPTHRLILAANSGYFKSLFSSDMSEVKEGYVIINSMKPTVMQQCIEFMYTSSYSLDLDSVTQLLEAAHYLQILKLENACFNFLKKNLSPINSLIVLNLARTFQSPEVEEAAKNVIQKNIESLLASVIVLEFPKRDLLHYISTTTPQTSWKATLTWSKKHKGDFLDLVGKLKFENFPVMFLLNEVFRHSFVQKCDVIKSVVKSVSNFMTIIKENINTENCFLFKQLAINDEAKLFIEEFLRRNFACIIKKDEFSKLTKIDLISLLESPEVNPEESKWEAILIWVNANAETRKKDFYDLFCRINLEKLPVILLKETVRHEELVATDLACMGLLVDALLDHPTTMENQDESDEEDIDDGGPNPMPPRPHSPIGLNNFEKNRWRKRTIWPK